MIRKSVALSLFGVLAAGTALAATFEGPCTTAPEAQWMSEDAAKAKMAEAGYTVSKIKKTRVGNCYEAYVTDKSGKRMELFLDPTDAKIIHSQ